jgi:hypothetical protein
MWKSSQRVFTRLGSVVSKSTTEKSNVVVLVSSDLSVPASDPVRVAGGGEVLGGVLGKSVGAGPSAGVINQGKQETY